MTSLLEAVQCGPNRCPRRNICQLRALKIGRHIEGRWPAMMNDPVNPNHIGDASVASTRMTTQSSPPSLAPKTAQRTSLGRRFQRALAGGPNRRFPGLHPSPGGAASLPSFLNRRLALPILAILALLAASLLFLLPGGLLQAQDATIDYAENDTIPVATFTGSDPEGRPVYWSLLATDAVAALSAT